MPAFIFVFLVSGGYYTDLSDIVVHDVFVVFTFTTVEVIWFDTFVLVQSLALTHTHARTHTHTHTHTHTQPFNGPWSGTTQVGPY